MYKLSVTVPKGKMVIQFAVQKRRADGKRVYRDTICYGVLHSSRKDDAIGPPVLRVFVPGITYQSKLDTYDVFEGVKYALNKFFQVNGIHKDIRAMVWESLLFIEGERKSFEDYQRIMRQRNNLGPLTASAKDKVAAAVQACEEGPPYGHIGGGIEFGEPTDPTPQVLQELVNKVEGHPVTHRQGPATEPDEKS